MNIGELFLNLGIKGAEKTVGALSEARKGLASVGEMSLEAKAGIIGAFYAFERLMEASSRMGTNLTNFSALTGLSAKELQQWQYAARQAGISGEEMTGSIKGVQNAMTNMLLGKGAPAGLSLVAGVNGGFDMSRARDSFYVLGELQKAAQRLPADVGNQMLKSFGISEGTIAAMRRNAFRPSLLNHAPTYSPGQIAALDRANIAWSNLSQKIEMAVGKFNASHGEKLVKDIGDLVPKVLDLANAFIKLADTLKIFQVLGKVFEGWSKIFGGTSDAVSNFADALKDPKKMDKLGQQYNDFLGQVPGALKLMGQDFMNFITPNQSPAMIPGKNQNININQNLNFQHEGKDAKKTGDSVHKANQDAFRQMSAQGQGS